MTEGLLFRLDAKWGSEDDLARVLEDELPSTLDDLPLTAWLVLRFGTTSFGLVVAFQEEQGRAAHVGERVALALRALGDMLTDPPSVEGFDVLAARAPAQSVSP
jgi:hypothetical protein